MPKCNYQGFYINLDRSIDRRIFIEHQLRENGVLEHYKRFDAIEYQEQPPQNTKLTKSELGCLQSHIQVLKSCKNSTKHIHIIEDDIKLSSLHHIIIEKFFTISDDWDILFTGIQMPLIKEQINMLIDLYKKQIQNTNNASMSFFDMSNFLFVGAFSYIINKKSISKILEIYDNQTSNEPIDFIFRKHICFDKTLKAKCAFPMLVAHSGEMDTTMKDRAFELTYTYQYLFQKPFIANSNLKDVYEEISKYASSIGYEMKHKSYDIESIYDELLNLGAYITSTNVHGKYRK